MSLINTVLDRFRRAPKPAALAKERLSIIVARERASTRGGAPDYLSQLQQDILAVLAKYERIDLEHVVVNLERAGICDVLELSVVLPERNLKATA